MKSYTEPLLLLRSGGLLARWTLLSLYLNEMQKQSVSLKPKLGKYSHPKKNWKPANISNRYSEDTFDFWLYWRLFWSVVTLCQGSSSSQWNWEEDGRSKNRNLIITGPANGAKTFMLKSLKLIFSDCIFENPANYTYAWLGSEKSKVFLLNDFRLSKDVIPWYDMLLMGEIVKLPAPKNIYSEDIMISTDVAIFATSKSPIKHRSSYNANDDRETDYGCQMEKLSFAINFLQKSKKICLPTQDVLQN